MGLVGCYDMHLYCDHPDHPKFSQMPHGHATGYTEADAIRAARRRGWIINKRGDGAVNGSGRCVCPKCKRGSR